MLKIQSRGGRTLLCGNGQASLLVFPDPTSPLTLSRKGEGLRGASGEMAERVLLSVPQENDEKGVISWPGEYEYGGIAIRGLSRNGGKTVSYVVVIEELRCGFLSSPIGKWSEHDIEQLGDLDVLVVPADDAKLVQAIVEEVDPPVVIPVKTKEDGWREVVAACGGEGVKTVEEVKLKKGALPTESREVYVLEG